MKPVVIIVLLLMGMQATAQADTTKRPIAIFEELAYDFGEIPRGKPVKHKFLLKNTGNAPLIIEEAKGTGGGQLPEWSSEPVKPGDSAYITIIYGAFNPGAFNKTVEVSTNAGNFMLMVKGTVYEIHPGDYQIDEMVHDFGKISKMGGLQWIFNIYNMGKYPLIIDTVTTNSGVLRYSWPTEPIPPKGMATIKAWLLVTTSGPFNEPAAVHFAGGTEPLTLYLRGEFVTYR